MHRKRPPNLGKSSTVENTWFAHCAAGDVLKNRSLLCVIPAFDSGRSLRDLSINCISAINPDQASPKVSRGRNFKSGGSVVTNKISTINDEQSLSSSAIARVISVFLLTVNFLLVGSVMRRGLWIIFIVFTE